MHIIAELQGMLLLISSVLLGEAVQMLHCVVLIIKVLPVYDRVQNFKVAEAAHHELC